MAKVLKEYKFARHGSYHWDEWLDGRIYRLIAGEDFTATPYSFRTHGYKLAKQKGLALRCHIEDGNIVLQATKR